MKLKRLQLLGLIGAILLLAGAFFIFSKKPDTTENNQDRSEVQNVQGSAELLDAFESGKSTMCVFLSGGNNGTVYVTQNNIRADFVDEKGNAGSMIFDGEWAYVWGASFPQGIKSRVDPQEINTNEQLSNVLEPEENVTYKCSSWTADMSKFALPEDVEFTDFTQQITAFPTINPASGENPGQPDCSVCASLTGEAKTVCEENLCN